MVHEVEPQLGHVLARNVHQSFRGIDVVGLFVDMEVFEESEDDGNVVCTGSSAERERDG